MQFVSSYVANLRSKTGYYIGYIPNEYADQVEADNFYEVLRKDSEVYRTLHLLSIMAAGEKVLIEAEDENLKAWTKHSISHIEDFIHARKSLIEKSVLFGLGVQRKYYKEIDIGNNTRIQVVHRLQEVDRRRLRLERDSEDKNKIYWTIWHPTYDNYVILEDRSVNPMAPDGCAMQDYVWYVQMHEEMSPYYEGFGEVLYTFCYIKSKTLQYWGDLAESWSKPFITASIDLAKAAVSAPLGDGYATAKQRVENILSAIEKSRARHCLVTDVGDQVSFNEHGSTGSNILRELLEYCDKQIELLILGAELTTSTSSSGSYALGSVHKEATDSIVIYNRFRLAEVLNRDLVKDFFIRNASSLHNYGLKIPDDNEIKLRFESEFTEEQKLQIQQQTGVQGNFPSQIAQKQKRQY